MAREEELFGGVSLFGNDDNMIEIPDGNSTQSTQYSAEIEIEDTAKPKGKADTTEDDGMFEIPTFKKSDKEVEEEIPATKVDKTDNKKDDDSSSKKGTSSSSAFRSFANALNEEGIISSFSEEEYAQLVEQTGSEAEALIELNRRTIEGEIEAYKEESEAEYKAFLEARDAGVNLNDWAAVQDNKKRFGKITDEDLDSNDKLQKQLITEDLKKRGFADEDIIDTIESYEDTNKLGNMSKKALKNLKRFEDEREEGLKTAAIENDKKNTQAAKQQVEDLKKEITRIEEIIPGAKLNKITRDKILQNITTPVKTLEDGRQLNAVMVKRADDPIKYAILEAYFVEQGFFDGKFDKFVAKAKTNAVKDLEKQITGDTSYHSGKAALSSSGSDEVDKDYELGWKNVGRR
jgi:hypothetical protein